MGRAIESVGPLISCVVGSVEARSGGSPHSVARSRPSEVRDLAGPPPLDP